jgi:hypothetical protein
MKHLKKLQRIGIMGRDQRQTSYGNGSYVAVFMVILGIFGILVAKQAKESQAEAKGSQAIEMSKGANETKERK